jgi:hypothetical protein
MDRPVSFTLFTLDGRPVLSGRLQAGRTALDLGSLPDGLYMIRTDGEPFSVARVVKGPRP